MIATAPAGLDAGQRSKLERLVTRARVVLETDLAEQAEGRFGIHVSGAIEEEDALPDDSSDRITRRDLEEIVAHLRTLGEDPPGAVARLLREATFTQFNRLVAIRIAESIGLLPESLANGQQSAGFRDLGEIMPMLAGDYRAYLRLCGDELAADAPALFDPRNPLLALEPSTAALDELVALVANPATTGIWQAPDALGWAYQFFNTGDERREMREVSAPRDSRELAVRNQFFTPRYVVEFLVQNTLGRRLMESDPTSALLDELHLLVDPPTERGPALELDDVKCLDPACGSGHFLLGCYDLLERAWELAGSAPSESAPAIVASLWGVDIDARCAQVASAAIILRARRHCRDVPLPRPNIITARGLPGGATALPVGVELTPDQRSLIDRVSEVLDQAPVLGPLLKTEEVLDREIRHGLFEGKVGTLSLTDAAADAAERELLSHLRTIADQASSSVPERLLAAEADDALRFVDAMRQRYDAVLMNPPFGLPVPSSAPYLRKAYGSSPSELYACFVSRGIELTKPTGLVGAITNRTGFFLSSLESWRSKLIDHGITCFADLGSFVLEGAQVEVAAYVIGRKSQHATFIRCLTVRDKAAALNGRPARLVFSLDPVQFRSVPSTCFAYWVGEQFLSLFSRCEPFEAHDRKVSRGLSAGDNFRFFRTRWEVRPDRIASGHWVPISKGGEYSPFFDDVHLVIYWKDLDRPYREVEGARIFNLSFQGHPGICWPKRTTSLPSARPLPAGTFFEANSIPAFADDLELILGWANTRIFALCFLMQVGAGDAARGSAAKDWVTGPARRLPWVTPKGDRLDRLRALGVGAALAARSKVSASETAALFVAPECLLIEHPPGEATLKELVMRAVEAREEFEIAVLESKLGLDLEWAAQYGLDQSALEILDTELEPAPASYGPQGPISDDVFAAAYSSKGPVVVSENRSSEELLDVRVEARRRSQVGLRSLEDLCHLFTLSPRAVVSKRRSLALLRQEDLRKAAEDLLSYLVGVALGRWDVRIGRNPAFAQPSPGLFDPVPVCPPAMLVSSAGTPTVGAPEGYPLELPPMRLLVDEPGHLWDIEAAVFRSAGALFDHPGAILADVLQILGRKSVRDHLRNQFFKDHISRYSKSRRQAPLYWPLTIPSRGWGVWAYAPSLSRETLYAVASEAAKREQLASQAIASLQREQYQNDHGRPARNVAAELEVEERLAEELRRFRAEAERVAGLGWKPDLDDGIVLCAAPLARLFPSWPDAETARTDLRKGKYKWATVAAWADQL